MQCPFCSEQKNKVVDSRRSKEGIAIRRRRECLCCHRRFTTYERVEEIPFMVVKKGGGREPFDRSRMLTGLLRSCEKRPVARHQLEQVERLSATYPSHFPPHRIIGKLSPGNPAVYLKQKDKRLPYEPSGFDHFK